MNFWGETTTFLIHVHPHSEDAAQADFHPVSPIASPDLPAAGAPRRILSWQYLGEQHPTTRPRSPSAWPGWPRSLEGMAKGRGAAGWRQPHLRCARCRRCPRCSTSCSPPPPLLPRSECRACREKSPMSQHPMLKDPSRHPPPSTQKLALRPEWWKKAPQELQSPYPKPTARAGEWRKPMQKSVCSLHLAPRCNLLFASRTWMQSAVCIPISFPHMPLCDLPALTKAHKVHPNFDQLTWFNPRLRKDPPPRLLSFDGSRVH